MSKSTQRSDSRATVKPTKNQYSKSYADFPLFSHQTGRGADPPVGNLTVPVAVAFPIPVGFRRNS